MTTTFTEIELPLEIRQAVRGKLDYGHSLAKLLLLQVPERPFRVRSFLPRGILPDRTLRIDEGGLWESDIANKKIWDDVIAVPIIDRPSRRWLVAQILDFFERNADGVVVFEDAMARRGDPYLANRKSEVWYYGDEAVLIVRAKDSDEERVETAIREGHNIPIFIGVMSSGIWRPNREGASNELDQQDLHAIARGTKAIIIGAYDGEGYLICDDL